VERERPRDRLSLWLRPRDVHTVMQSTDFGKSDDLAMKAVGSGGGPDNPCLMTDVFYSYDNSENNKTKRDGDASH